MLLSTCLLFKFLFMLRDINSQDINSDPSKSSYLFMQSLLVTISEFNEGVTYFQLRVLRIIFFILVHLSISEITGDIDFTFVYKGFYHKNICMNPQCKDREITNNYFTCCDIFHLTVLWKELAVVRITDGLISHNLEFGSSEESSCIALAFFTPSGFTSSPGAETVSTLGVLGEAWVNTVHPQKQILSWNSLKTVKQIFSSYLHFGNGIAFLSSVSPFKSEQLDSRKIRFLF